MGRIKGTVIKRATKELLAKYKGEFTTTFEENKKVVNKYVTQKKVKKFKNSIAGFISRIMCRNKKEEEREARKKKKEEEAEKLEKSE